MHKLVAEVFLGSRPPGMQVDHIDGNKRNNAASNLEYVTGKESMRRAYRLGLVKPPPGRRFQKGVSLVAALRFILADPGNNLTEDSRRLGQNAIDGLQ